MTGDKKGEIINAAYSWLRVSGLTSTPSPGEVSKALAKLENMMANFSATKSICVGYTFEDEPNVNSLHNVERGFWEFMETTLAIRLAPDYNLVPTQELHALASAGLSAVSLHSGRENLRQVNYPGRQPRGSGNMLRGDRWRRFFSPTPEAPMTCETNTMFIENINDFVEHFDALLADGETIASFTIEATAGLDIVSSSLATPDVSYRIEALGVSTEDRLSYNSAQQVQIQVTTSTGRVSTRLIDFRLDTIPEV